MGFTINQYNAQQPGNIFHFWQVTCLDADTQSAWVATAFQGKAQLALAYAVNGTGVIYTGLYNIELNTADQVIGGVTFGPGFAWRLNKGAAGGSGGTVRVVVAFIPGSIR